ncbi:hypothetical protein [Pseudonocardia nigra]|uniref:hypothetical protein n=1 Tax=Pseudonocardia nigra TaxID=1921578 RepID=UPI001C5E10D7|nr:hypothetical protein [Pseudonocardia nigra]
MPPDIHVTAHIHTDGPIPGPHSLLTLTSAAHAPGGGLISTFSTNVRELPGATLHPIALETWRRRAEDWLCTRRASRPPAIAMTAYARWIERLPGPAVFVADTAEPDYLFLFWYLQRFTGRWPFAGTHTDAALHGRLACTTSCPLAGCREPDGALAATS